MSDLKKAVWKPPNIWELIKTIAIVMKSEHSQKTAPKKNINTWRLTFLGVLKIVAIFRFHSIVNIIKLLNRKRDDAAQKYNLNKKKKSHS